MCTRSLSPFSSAVPLPPSTVIWRVADAISSTSVVQSAFEFRSRKSSILPRVGSWSMEAKPVQLTPSGARRFRATPTPLAALLRRRCGRPLRLTRLKRAWSDGVARLNL
jgi:hypothetical protein